MKRNKALLSYGFFGSEHECPVCGKIFLRPNDQWAYVRYSGKRQLWMCSYRCFRKWKETHGNKIERRENIIRAIQDGLNNGEIARLLGESPAKVDYWRRKLREEQNDETDNGNL